MAKTDNTNKKIKLSLFKNSFAELPDLHITLDEMADHIREGKWKSNVLKLRSLSDPKYYKKIKEALPAITVSGEFKTRDKYTPFKQRIIRHTGLICLDIDKKDNPKLSIKTVIDKDCLMQYVSCSGEGLKIIYRCETTKDQSEHRRIYDAAVQRLAKKGIKLKVDPIVKSISSLQYVSYDPNVFYFPKSKLIITPLPAPKRIKSKPSEDQKKELEQLQEYIEALGDRDVTKDYDKWLTIAFGLSYSLGEAGRQPFHELSKNYAEYAAEEVDEKFDACLERSPDQLERPVTISSVYQILNDHLPKAAARQLTKKYNKGHAVGVGEDIEEGDLAGMVRYKLFLFKKVFDKKTNTLTELYPHDINLNAFEALLKSKGFFRYDELFVNIKDNIVESVDRYDILRMVTDHVEGDGDYTFTYQKMEFKFGWEELVHLWRKVRGQSSIFNQIGASLTHWEPKLLKDTADISYIPYLNGVLEVTKKGYKLLPYNIIKAQIWRERILQRDFTYSQEIGMFEEFFGNVCGDEYSRRKDIIKQERYKRNLWYFGYMLHSYKIKSRARVWMLYDIKAGNNGRTGKSIMGQAVGHIRNVTTIDGKQLDLRNNRFAFQKVTPWTEVLFIDDPHKGITLNPLFNMITGDTDAERKGKEIITLNLKVMIASNWVMEMEGTSEQGRQFVTQFNDYYVKYAEEKNTIQPLVDIHKKEFFDGWDKKDWMLFDSFCIRALQYYMSTENPGNKIVGNTAQLRFTQQHEYEIFFELSMAFCSNVRLGRDGKLLVPQKVLVNVIKDSGDFTGIKAGRIVKEYLTAINAGKCTATSMVVGTITQMGYGLENPFDRLNFGDLKNQLPKVKWQ